MKKELGLLLLAGALASCGGSGTTGSTPVNPTPVNPTPVNPTPVNPTPVNPNAIIDIADSPVNIASSYLTLEGVTITADTTKVSNGVATPIFDKIITENYVAQPVGVVTDNSHIILLPVYEGDELVAFDLSADSTYLIDQSLPLTNTTFMGRYSETTIGGDIVSGEAEINVNIDAESMTVTGPELLDGEVFIWNPTMNRFDLDSDDLGGAGFLVGNASEANGFYLNLENSGVFAGTN